MIGFVQLNKDELPGLRELIEIEEMDETGLFLQPCSKLGPQGCTIYTQRPVNCRLFNCKLLKSVQDNELSFEAAMDVLTQVRMKMRAIEAQIATLPVQLKSRSFKFQMRELRKLLQEATPESPLSQGNLNLLSDIDEFNSLVAATFGVSIY